MFEVLSDPRIYEHENSPPDSVEALHRRFEFLERRASPDGLEHWLNWVIRLPSGELAGYVQATVFQTAEAMIAYELNSRHWGRGLALSAVALMLDELTSSYGVQTFSAVLKRTNTRSLRLLEKFGFAHAPEAECLKRSIPGDELLMLRPAAP